MKKIKNIKNENFNIAQILKSKIINDEKGFFTIEKKEDNNNKDIQDIYDNIYDFLYFFL